MLDIKFNNCCYIFARGRNRGLRCNKPCDFGLCEQDMIRFKLCVKQYTYDKIYDKIIISSEISINVIENAVKSMESNIGNLMYYVNLNDLKKFNSWTQSYNKNILILKLLLLKESIIEDVYHEIIKLYVPIECDPFIKVYQLAFI